MPQNDPNRVARHLVIRGHVQGVGYRWSMVAQARRLGLVGWVRNRRDGSVEAVACGSVAGVDGLLDWARQGPPGARVSEVLISEAAGANEADSFEQRDTA